MSHVFVAEEVALGRKVVVKVLREELAAEISVERFKREIAVALGDFVAAFAALDRSVAAHDAWLWTIETVPELDPVRTDPRFRALRRRVFGDFVTGAER